MGGLLVVWFGSGVLCAGICSALARRKVANSGRWALYGLIFGVFAIAYLLWLPNVFTEDADTPKPRGVAPGMRKGKKRTTT